MLRISRQHLITAAVVAVLLSILMAGLLTKIPWLVNVGFVIVSMLFLAVNVEQITEAKHLRGFRSNRNPRALLGACWELVLILIGLGLFLYVAGRGLRIIPG